MDTARLITLGCRHTRATNGISPMPPLLFFANPKACAFLLLMWPNPRAIYGIFWLFLCWHGGSWMGHVAGNLLSFVIFSKLSGMISPPYRPWCRKITHKHWCFLRALHTGAGHDPSEVIFSKLFFELSLFRNFVSWTSKAHIFLLWTSNEVYSLTSFLVFVFWTQWCS